MSTDSPKLLTHRVAGRAQVGLSYFFFSGFFLCVILQGLGYLKVDISRELEEMAMLVLSFWFNRQRTSVDEPSKVTPSVPTAPPQAAGEVQK